MKTSFLILNQPFYPDVQATAQFATDLALGNVQFGHEVTALAGACAYGRPDVVYSAEENWRGIHIRRVNSIDFGKQSRWRRALNFGSFILSTARELAWTPHQDHVVALTTPPLITVLGAASTRLKGGQLHAWIMDLNPDEAIAAGWLSPESLIARGLKWSMNWSLHQSSTIFVLDRFMKDRIVAKGIAPDKIHIIPPWSRDAAIVSDEDGRREFRRANRLTGKYVVMYSGNHSPCHPLHTLLEAAKALRDDPRFLFCFIGGGSEHPKVQGFAIANCLDNIICLPYVPKGQLSASLLAADLHVVAMGDPFVGIVHPSKVYNILALGMPFLYIGPSESHVTDLAPPGAKGRWYFPARHGEVDRVVSHILAAEQFAERGSQDELAVAARFNQNDLVTKMSNIILGNQPDTQPTDSPVPASN